MSELWFVIFGSLGIIVGASVVLATSAETRIRRHLGAGVAIGVVVLGIILWGALNPPFSPLTSSHQRWLLISASLGIVVGACAVLGRLASRGRGERDKAGAFSGVPRIVTVRILAVLVASLPVVIIVVGNLRPSVTWWEPPGGTAAEPFVAEAPGPEHCHMEDTMFLGMKNVAVYVQSREFNLGNFASFDPNATLPDSAINTGWHAGERELWIDPSVYGGKPTRGLEVGWDHPGPRPPDAIYVVSPWGVERWPQAELCL